MDLILHASFLPYDDAEASLAFYRDILGFEVRWDVAYDGIRRITARPPGRPGTALVLEPPAAERGVTVEERRTVVEMMAKGTYARVLLSTGELDRVFARLLDAGAEVAQEPAEQPDGVRDCAVRDPAGTLLRIRELR
ncbi:VOC family protein [Streptomyces sp. NPDC019507]|uniref:VOC family protein n=1 Tax=Streptomyces sp. NPDC019507 TaxID=3154689 RepID=UPI0033F39E28